jgi:MoaD family protein
MEVVSGLVRMTLDASITVETRYYAFLHEITGVRVERFNLGAGATVQTLIEALNHKYGDRLRQYVLTEKGSLRPSIAVAINGQKITGDPLRHPLKDGDVVVIIPPISGGSSPQPSQSL